MKNNIKKLLAKKKMSQTQLGDAVGVERTNMNMLINRNVNVSVILGLRIAKVLGVEIEQIFIV